MLYNRYMSISFHWMQRIHWPCDNEGLRQMAKELEDAGVESVLLPYGPEGQDFSMHLPDIFRDTQKIRMMLAIGAYAATPEYVAKTFFTAQQFGENRVDLNLVAGRYSDEFEQMAMNRFPGDKETISSHTKRVALTEAWMDKFVEIVRNERYTTRLAVVGSSETTIRIANKHTDYMIINGDVILDGKIGQLTSTKPILVIDPLILEDGMTRDKVEYHDYKFTKNRHFVEGTYDQVVEQILKFYSEFGIKDFIVHTDQKDITQLLRLVKDLSQRVDLDS